MKGQACKLVFFVNNTLCRRMDKQLILVYNRNNNDSNIMTAIHNIRYNRYNNRYRKFADMIGIPE